jgi:hypothetical protein
VDILFLLWLGAVLIAPLPMRELPSCETPAAPAPFKGEPAPFKGEPAPFKGEPAPFKGEPNNNTPNIQRIIFRIVRFPFKWSRSRIDLHLEVLVTLLVRVDRGVFRARNNDVGYRSLIERAEDSVIDNMINSRNFERALYNA